MAEWRLFGDVNTLDEGGILVRKEYDEEEYDFQKTTYQVIQIIPHPEDEKKCLAGIASIDVSDYRKNEELMESYKSYFGTENFTDEVLAYSVMDYYNMAELSSLSFNGKRAEYSCSIMEYDVNKWKLAKSLKEDYGYENDNINEWANKKVGKIKDFVVDDFNLELGKKTTLLLEAHEPIANLYLDIDGGTKEVIIEIAGETNLTFNGETYCKASSFPSELVEKLKKFGDEWNMQAPSGEGNDEDFDEENYTSLNNWAEMFIEEEIEGRFDPSHSDVVELEGENAKSLLEEMLDFAKDYYKLDVIENENEWKDKVSLHERNNKNKGER